MSSEASSTTAWLALRLEAPLQSWGFEDRFSRRKTGLLPTKSALLGLCCAALGAGRGSEEEKGWMPKLNKLELLTIAIPRVVEERPLTVRRMEDYHTVQNTRTADGKIKETHITHRTYLNDAAFAAILYGSAVTLRALAAAIADPVWGIWLGRKACIPSAPVLVGVFETEIAALAKVLNDQPLTAFTHQREVNTFADGTDTFMDSPVTFADPREFSPRRVKLERASRLT
jgi:CRISPR system Cascade subunit CasD